MSYDVSYHKPIMVDQIKEYLDIKEDGIYLDGTLGGGGHSQMILDNLSNKGRLISLDKDDEAIEFSKKRLEKYGEKFLAIKSDHLYANNVLDDLNIDKLDGVLLDLGVSSHQLDDFERGFSYRASEVELDMRMDKAQDFSAKNLINEYSFEDLRDIFFKYGEEKFSSKIAKNIEKHRELKTIETCGELVDIIKEAVPFYGKKEGHPAKRVFQAIRIEVNGEIKDLYKSIENLSLRLKPGGRIAILTFHSLEDRIAKNVFRDLYTDCVCPKSFPVCMCDKRREVEILTRKPITATEEEILRNPRSKPAKLRVAMRI